MRHDVQVGSQKPAVTTYSVVEGVAPYSASYTLRDRATSTLQDTLDASDHLRHAVLFLPIVLIVLQSYFRSSLVEFLGTAVPFDGNAIYWAVRILLFGTFLALLFRVAPTKAKRPERPIDLYSAERSARDPLLGLRALACINVFLGHWFMVVYGPSTPPTSTREYVLRTTLSFSPWCGVWMFFTLSGYLMGKGFVTGRHTVDRAGLTKFYKNRILRIFPIYFVSIFLVAVLMNPTYLDVRNSGAVNRLLEAGLFDQQAGGVIGALWSVSTEFQFYLIAPMLFLLLSMGFKHDWSRFMVVAALCVLIGMTKLCILNRAPTLWQSRVYYPLLLNLDCFLAGMATSFFVNGLLKKQLYVPKGIAIGIVVTILAQIGISTWSFHEMCAYEGFPGSATRLYYLSFAPGATAIATCLIIGLFELAKRTPSTGNVAWRVSGFLGAMTYCFYVFHEPVITSLRRLWPATLKMQQSMAIFPFGFAACLAVACIFYYFVETRFDRLRSRPQ